MYTNEQPNDDPSLNRGSANKMNTNPADDLDQQDLPDVMAQRLTELDRRISKLEKDAQGDVPPSIHEVIQKQQR